MTRSAPGALAPLVALLTAAWLGAVALFGAVVAPAAFDVLPSRSLAGALAGRVLPVLFLSGMVVGAGVIAAARAGGARGSRRGALAAGLVVLLACGAAHFVIGGRIERLRDELPAALDELPVEDRRRVTFGRLHGFSVAALGLAATAAVVGAGLLMRRPR